MPKRECDTFLEVTSRLKVPVWIVDDHFVSFCTMADGKQCVYSVKADFNDEDVQALAAQALLVSIAELYAKNPQPTHGKELVE